MREIDFEKVNKFGYDEQKIQYPITSFRKYGTDLCKDTAMVIMYNSEEEEIVAVTSIPNRDNTGYYPIYSVGLLIKEDIDENDISTFFEVATKFFDIYTDPSYDDRKNYDNRKGDADSLIEFIKGTSLDIRLKSLNNFLNINGDNDTRRDIQIKGDPRVFIRNIEEDVIVNLYVEGYSDFDLFCDSSVLFKLPKGYGTDAVVTSDINHILKCLRNFRTKIDVLDLFATDQEKDETFVKRIADLGEELSSGLSELKRGGGENGRS